MPCLSDPGAARPIWRLAAHLRACEIDGQIILLDLERNRYAGIGSDGVSALGAVIEGWPATTTAPASPAGPIDLDALAAPLLAQGWIEPATQEPTLASLTPTELPEALCSLNADDAVLQVQVGPRRTVRFLGSAARAAASLRWSSLLTITHRLAARRERLVPPGQRVPEEALRDAVAAGLKLRPLVFTAQDRCLHDALTLVHFLAGEGIAARWVIGVRTRPFGAHAWVQRGDQVLNDPHEFVRRYRPLLVV